MLSKIYFENMDIIDDGFKKKILINEHKYGIIRTMKLEMFT